MKHSTRLLVLSLLLTALLSGCSLSSTTVSTKSIAIINEDKLDESIFPKDQIIDVNITVDEADFQNMLDNATAEQFIQADVNYNGHLLENVGLRTKGNSSLSSVAGMSDSDRYSFKLSLDEYVTQSIGGITKINLNNEYSDASYMREYLAYEIAESMGIATPKYSFVNIYINGELWGLYTAVEQMGSAFIEREFSSAKGTLYKSNGGDGADLSALSSFDDYTGLDVKYGSADKDALLEMTDLLNNGDAANYDTVLDVQAALRFIAFNTVTANMDSYAGNFKHNYYLYELDGVFTVIPWDLNMAFGGFGGSGILIDEPTGVSLTSRPLIDKLIAEDAYREEYHQIIQDMITNYFSGDTFENRVRELQAMISDSVKNDPTAFVTFEQFEQGVESLISFVNTQTESITKQLSGEIATYGDGSGSAGNGMGGGFGGFGGGRGNGQMPDGMQFPNGMQLPDGMQMPDGMQLPDGMQMPDGMQLPDGMQMPDGMQQAPESSDEQGDTTAAKLEASNQPATSAYLSVLAEASPSDEQQQAAETVPDLSSNNNNQAQNLEEGQVPNTQNGLAPNAQGGQMPNTQGGQTPNAQGGQASDTQGEQMPNAQGGQMPNFENGQMPNFENGQMPNFEEGQMPNFGNGNRPQGGGFGGGMPGMMNGQSTATVDPAQQQEHLKLTLISVGLLIAGCLVVVFWRRKSI